MRQSRPGGIALILVFIVLTVLTLLVSAFLQVNRSHFALVRNSDDRDRAYAACKSAFEYCVYRFEHDKTWGAAPFAGDNDDELPADLTVTEVKDQTSIAGTIPSLGATFTVDIANNLNQETENDDGIPGESARLLIQARVNDSARTVDCLIRVAPLFDSSILSRGTMSIGAEEFLVRSRDPYRNMVRAEGQVTVPNALTASYTRFLKPDSTQRDSKGILWSRSDIVTGSPVPAPLSGDKVDQASANSGGRFIPNAKQKFGIYDLTEADIDRPANAVAVAPGEYRFTMANATITVSSTFLVWVLKEKDKDDDKDGDKDKEWEQEERIVTDTFTQAIHVMEHYDPPNGTAPDRVYRSETRTSDLAVPIPDKGELVPGTTTVDNVEIVYDTPGVDRTLEAQIGDVVDIGDGSGRVTADLLNQQVTLAPGTTVTSTGDFWLTSKRGDLPTLNLTDDGAQVTAIVADKEIRLENALTDGFGTLIAKAGDVRLQPRGRSDKTVEAVEQLGGLVLYASKDVVLTNPDKADWTFYGLVYAHGNFFFNANGANVTLEGTLVAKGTNLTLPDGTQVAQGGIIDLQNAATADFIYNPRYLRKKVRALPLDRIQVERLIWRE